MAIDENTPTIEVVKSPSGKPIESGAAPESAEGAMISNVNEEGFVQADDVTATREVVSPTTLPLSYEYDEKQMMANVSTAISADIEDMTERELLEDETFGFASKKMFRAFRGEDFTGTDEEATQFGIDLMRRVENNLVELGDFSYQVQDMSGDEAQIALYMMDMFEAKEFTGRGFGEALGYMGLDPTTYIGLGTFGFGFAGKEAAKAATKQGMRAVLQKMAYSGATVGAVEGAVYTGAFEHGKQVVSEAAGEGYDSGSVGLNVAIGAGVGAAAGKYLPEIFDYAGEKVARWSAAKNFKAEVRAAADAGDADAIKVLADMELLDNHFDSDGFMGRKLDEFEQTRVGQAVTGVQRIVADDGNVIVEDAPAFFSQLENALKTSTQKAWNKQQLQGFLKKQGVKDEEIKWSGIGSFLDGLEDKTKLTTDEILENFASPRLEKKIFGKKPELASESNFILDKEDLDDEVLEYLSSLNAKDRAIAENMMTQTNRNLLTDGTFERDWDMLLSKYPNKDHNIIHDVGDALFDEYHAAFSRAEGELKYQSYATRDIGTKYREELTTFERDDIARAKARRIEMFNDDKYRDDSGAIKPEYRDEWDELRKLEDTGESYRSSHWDNNNILYHVRKQDVKIDDDKTMLIEEIQSDWHQKGRKKGYRERKPMPLSEINKKISELETKRKEITSDENFYKSKTKVDELQNLSDEVSLLSGMHVDYYSKVPDAPYSKTWHEKAMKDQIAEAVANDYDRVAWVAGKEQAERYSLSSQVDYIDVDNTKEFNYIYILQKDNTDTAINFDNAGKITSSSNQELEGKMLDAVVGKEMANKITNIKGEEKIQGDGLEVGGEGMKTFYDKMLPKWTDKYIKKYGSKVEVKKLSNGQEVWSFPVTDKMKKEIKSKGQALYSAATGAAGFGALQTEGDDNAE